MANPNSLMNRSKSLAAKKTGSSTEKSKPFLKKKTATAKSKDALDFMMPTSTNDLDDYLEKEDAVLRA